MSDSLKVVPGKHYLAFVLDSKCREEILSLYPKRFKDIVCHHVTIAYDVKGGNIEALQDFINEDHELKLNGFVKADGIDLFLVLIDGHCKRKFMGGFYHLTFTKRTDRHNNDSNRVFTDEISYEGMLSAGMILTGGFALLQK